MKIGLSGLLTVIFVIAKILGYISWSWLWVLSPIWITFGFVLAVFAVVAMIAGVVWIFED